MFAWRVIARTQTSGKRHDLSACRDPHGVRAASELHAGGKDADCGRGLSPRRDRQGRGPAARDPRKPAVQVAPADAGDVSNRRSADFCAGDGNTGTGYGGPAELTLRAVTTVRAVSCCRSGSGGHVLPDGARVRLEGAVEPALAAAVVSALAGRPS